MELLVAMLIVGVLAVLALPVIGVARKRSGQVRCTQNLRQIGLALHRYMDDQGSFPYVNVGTTRWYDGSFAKSSFFGGPYLGVRAQWQRYATPNEPSAKGSVMDCPLIGEKEKEGRGPDDWVNDYFDYALNITLCGRTRAEVARPSGTVMVAEGGRENRVKAQLVHGKVYNKGSTEPVSPGGTQWNWAETKGGVTPIIYSKGGNRACFLFMDGHIGLHTQDELAESWFDAQ